VPDTRNEAAMESADEDGTLSPLVVVSRGITALEATSIFMGIERGFKLMPRLVYGLPMFRLLVSVVSPPAISLKSWPLEKGLNNVLTIDPDLGNVITP